MNQKLLLPILLSVILLSVIPAQNAYACDFITHPEKCVKDVVKDVIKATVDPVIHDVKKVQDEIKHDLESLEGDLLKEVRVIEDDVKAIVEDTENVEKALVDDVVKDVKDIKEDIAKIDQLIVSVENIEKKVVDTAEEVVKTIINDIKNDWIYVIYALIVIGVGYVAIRITQFAIWLKAYLRQDGIEHAAKKQIEQNDEIIALLKTIAKK